MSLRSFVLLPLFLFACESNPTAPRPDEPAPVAVDPDKPAPTTPELDLRADGAFARAARPLPDGGLLVLYEKPVHLRERWGRPDRTLVWLDKAGQEQGRQEATVGRELLDAVAHPSGEVSVLEASNDGYALLRFDRNRAKIAETALIDDAILTDLPTITQSESRSRIETVTHDVGRLAADGEDVFLATRTGRHSVVAYRMTRSGASFLQRARTLVVPAHPIMATALNGGSYDTFGQLDAHYGVFIDVDANGIGWVGVGHARMEAGAFVKAHQKVFGESLTTDPDYLDAYVSRIARDGTRLGTTVISTPNDEQLYGLRAIGDSAYAVGRSENWNASGTGFDALVAHIGHDGVATVRTFDVAQGDIAFDVAPATEEGILVAGASGYSQNPNGASLSEESHTFVRWLHTDGSITALGNLPDGPRHSEARFVLPGTAPVVGGMLDGPGTHSADGDSSLLRAQLFVKRLSL